MRNMKVLLAGAAACLAWTASGTVVNVADGETVVIGTDVASEPSIELVVTTGASGVTLVLPPADAQGTATVWTRIYLQGTGTVSFVAAEGQTPTAIVIAAGLAADDTATLHVAAPEVKTLGVGVINPANVPNLLHYPVADIAHVTFANAVGEFALRGYCTARKVPTDFAVRPGAEVALQGTDPLGFGDAFTLTDYDLLVLSTDAIPSTCTVTVNPGRTLSFKPCNPTLGAFAAYPWLWTGVAVRAGNFPVVLNGKGARILCRNVNTARLTLLTTVSGTGEVLFLSDSTVGEAELVFRGMTYRSIKSKPVSIPINTATEPVFASQHSWTNKVSHWFDASDAATVIKYARAGKPDTLRYEFEGRYPVICGWKDHIKDMRDKFLFSRDAFNGCFPYFLPYLVEGGLNGKDYVSFGAYYYDIDAATVDPLDCPSGSKISRWLQFVDASSTGANGTGKPNGSYTTLTGCKYCIMVFGSQFGGGKSILGDQNGEGLLGNLARGGSVITHTWLAYAGYSITVDGMPSKTSDKPNGGWQIVSLDMSATNTVLDCLGGHFLTKTSNNNLLTQDRKMTGGQNYAEILFFDEVPTAAERMACEQYLAEKWGVQCPDWDTSFTELSGSGPVSLSDALNPSRTGAEEVTVAGNYCGTLTVPAGKTLVVSDRPAPPSLYDVPQQDNLVAWFDPNLDGAIDFHEHPDAATGVARLYSRTASGVDKSNGAYWMGMQANGGITNVAGRYSFLAETSYLSDSGIGTPMKWLDFTKNGSGENLGNTMRSHKLPFMDVSATTSELMTFRSFFVALDTSAGGGNPVGDEVGFGGAIRPRSGTGADYTQPIWSANNTVTMAHTRLDTNEVNGATAGYSGRAGVLGFETATDFTTHRGLFFGYYNPNNSNKNYEHIGESLIYSTTLTDAERLTVQEYLMAKWTGDLNGKYTDLSRATVTGAGNVYSPSLRNLPAFDSDFTGTLSGGSNMTFTVDSSWNASAAVDAIEIARAVTIDAACAVKVTLKGEAKAGTYTLLTVPSGALAGKTFALTLVNETGKGAPAKLVASDTTLSLEILSQGTVLVVR
ncbi:MAG: hypothetical protein IJI36_18710 [Kiritimatiellae bacterium]|nr:hypothetical protein [Kiritimatiellia bacterium]